MAAEYQARDVTEVVEVSSGGAPIRGMMPRKVVEVKSRFTVPARSSITVSIYVVSLG
jgi:hypothetical protein